MWKWGLGKEEGLGLTGGRTLGNRGCGWDMLNLEVHQDNKVKCSESR